MKTKVKELRTAARMTQQQLADLVHVSSRTIILLDGELRETQTTDYFSKHRRSDCAVRELTAR